MLATANSVEYNTGETLDACACHSLARAETVRFRFRMRNGSSPHAKRFDSAYETAQVRMRNGSIPHAKRLIFRMRNARFVCDPKYVNEYVRMRSHAFRMRVVCESHANRIKIFHRVQPQVVLLLPIPVRVLSGK